MNGRNSKHWDPVFSKPRVFHDYAVYKDWPDLKTNPENHVDWIDVAQNEDEQDVDVDATSDIEPQPEIRENSTCEQKLVTMLLESLGASNASCETKGLSKFLSRQDNEAIVAEDDQAWAWVDDREISAGRSRDYSRGFNASGLQKTLENTVRVPLCLP